MLPLISVILPAYNAEEYLACAIHSILKQTFKDFELLIIDDGSSDGTESIVNSFRDERIKYFKNEINLGLIATLNKGISLAVGKYIARMDADDISINDRFERQYDFLEKNSEFVICSSSRYIFFENIGDSKIIEKVPETDSLIRVFSIFNSPFTHPATMFRRDVVVKNEILFDENFKYAEDYKFWIDLLKFGKGYNFGIPLIYYKINKYGQTSVGNKNKEERKSKILKVQNYALSVLNISINNIDNDILYNFSLSEYIRIIDLSTTNFKKHVHLLVILYDELSKNNFKLEGQVILGRLYLKLLVFNIKKIRNFMDLVDILNFKFLFFSFKSLLKF